MIRILHTADIHLGAKFSNLDPDKRMERRHRLKKQLTAVVDLAVGNKADALVIAGDLFDSPDPSRDAFDHAAAELGRLHQGGVRCYVIPGNHDYYIPGGLWDAPVWGEIADVFTNNTWQAATVESLGLTVRGIACHSVNSDADVLAGLSERGPGANIALLHGSLDRRYFRGERCYPFDSADVDKAPVDFLCLGHYHSYAQVGKSGRAAYSGSPEGLDFAETGRHYCLQLELENGEVKETKLETGSLTVEDVELDCTNIFTSSAVGQALREYSGADVVLRATLVGAAPPTAELDPAQILAESADRFFHLEVRDKTVVGDFTLAEGRSVQARFMARMARLAEAADDEERHLISLATRYGLAALRGKGKRP